MKKLSLLLVLVMALFSCSDNLDLDPNPTPTPDSSINPNLINTSGQIDGINYSLKNVELNSNVISLNSTNVNLVSSKSDLSNGILKLENMTQEVSSALAEGTILYISVGEYTTLKKVESIKSIEGNACELLTSAAQLGEVFEGGTIDFSLDLYEASKVGYQKQMRTKTNAFDKSHEILNLMDAYDLGKGLSYNPSTNVKLKLYAKLGFTKGQLLPNEFTTYFEIIPAVNPVFSFAGSVNHIYKTDIVQYIPAQLIDLIKSQEFTIDIPINALGIESLPAKIKIEDINIPTEIEANVAKESSLTYGINGSCKIGYTLNITGLNAKMTPIYENNIKAVNPSIANLHGELITNSDVVIVPNISILDDLYKVTGEISFGLKTETNANIKLPSPKPVAFGSKGVFSAKMIAEVDLILTKVPIQIINAEQEIWNVGSFDKIVTYSDLSWKVTSKYANNVLLLSRLYETDFTVNYKYPIIGKKIPEELTISYEVYQENGTSRIVSEKNMVIKPTNITANSFSFKLNIPYRSKFLSYQIKSYLKNIVISDKNGYVYEGILNSSTNINQNSFEIKR